MSLSVAPGGDHLRRGSSPFIVCADTVWSAFADAEPGEWQRYLLKRASQGFNAALISVLPIVGDRSVSPATRTALGGQGGGSGAVLDADYLRAAVRLAEAAAEAGMTPFLVLFWFDYVAGERGLAASPGRILDDEARSGYLDAALAAFAGVDPVYVVSGDEAFTRGDAGPYPGLLAEVRRRAPGSLTTLHSTPETVLPPALAGESGPSFYAYQSGHYGDRQDLTTALARQYLDLAPRKPVMNLEPCYEGHGYGAGAGRFSAADVRRALWWSLTAGACAGVGYGAHGLWQWHRPGGEFNGTGFSGTPFRWETALEFPGAWDAGLAAKLVADHGLYLARPANGLASAPLGRPGVLATADKSTVAVYLPYPSEVVISADLSAHRATAIDLARGRPFRPRISAAAQGARVDLPDFNGDALYLFQARG